MTETIFGRVELGKQEARNDPKNLQGAKYIDRAVLLPKLPVVSRHAVGIPAFPMFGNDRLADCTCSSVAHMTMVRSWRDGKDSLLTPAEADVEALYWATGSQDDGRYMDQVLNYWRQNPRPTLPAPKGYVQIDPQDEQMVKAAIYLFGGIYLGLNLPIAAQQMTAWDVPAGQKLSGEWATGSWGGHAIHVHAYNPTPKYHYDYVGVTWAQRISISQRFIVAYADEMFAVYHPLWIVGGSSPSGFDDAALENDLTAITAK